MQWFCIYLNAVAESKFSCDGLHALLKSQIKAALINAVRRKVCVRRFCAGFLPAAPSESQSTVAAAAALISISYLLNIVCTHSLAPRLVRVELLCSSLLFLRRFLYHPLVRHFFMVRFVIKMKQKGKVPLQARERERKNRFSSLPLCCCCCCCCSGSFQLPKK
jgi:hypothetical protein